MDPGDGSSTQVASGVIGEPVVESGDWRAQLQSDSRKKMVNKMYVLVLFIYSSVKIWLCLRA